MSIYCCFHFIGKKSGGFGDYFIQTGESNNFSVGLETLFSLLC